jgi:signal transduction histidine kinase
MRATDSRPDACGVAPIGSAFHDADRLADELEITSPGDPQKITADLVAPVFPCLIVLAGDSAGRVYAVDKGAVIGRGPEATLRFPYEDVSRSHAAILIGEDGELEIEDLQSRNGVRLNGVPVRRQALRFGDRITIGNSVLLLFTQRDGLEEQLLRSQRLESLGRLAGGIAHDFNNLLGTVLTNISFLRALEPTAQLGQEDVIETLVDSEAALRRAADLTSQLLGFARRGKYNEQPTDVAQLVEDVARLLRRTLDRPMQIILDVEPHLTVLGDATQLHQALMNIFINARDSMPDGGTINVTASRRAPDRSTLVMSHEHVVVEVADEGTGMDDETVRRAFEPFFTTKDVGKGTGLGLAMVYGIVKNHGGDVLVQSTVGVGTTMRIVLPASDPPEEIIDGRPTATSEEVFVEARVLLVDDEDLFRSSTRRLLEHLGYGVEVVSNGPAAIERIREGAEVDLVLLDLQMPQMSGEETLERLLEVDPYLPVVLVTAFADDGRAQRALKRGARGLVHKPFDVETLMRAIKAATLGT